MKKSELIRAVAEETELARATVERVLAAASARLRRDLDENNETTLDGFGKLKVVEVAARCGRNPKTGESIQILAHNRVKFHPSVELKRVVNE